MALSMDLRTLQQVNAGGCPRRNPTCTYQEGATAFRPPPGLTLPVCEGEGTPRSSRIHPAPQVQQILPIGPIRPPPGLPEPVRCSTKRAPDGADARGLKSSVVSMPSGALEHLDAAVERLMHERSAEQKVDRERMNSMRPIGSSITTLVIQNLPGRYTQEDVLKMWPIDGTFDYMHVPYNLLQKRPLGYVFINFISNELAVAFQQRWHGTVLPGTCSTRKPLDVAAAEVQGSMANLELIKGRKIGQLGKVGFLPILLRNGERLDAKAIVAEMTGSRESKGQPKTVQAARFRPTKEDACSDSDAPTTATGGDLSACDPWADDASQEETSQPSLNFTLPADFVLLQL